MLHAITVIIEAILIVAFIGQIVSDTSKLKK